MKKIIKKIIASALVGCCSLGVIVGASCGKTSQAENQPETTLNIVSTPLSEFEAVNLGLTTTATSTDSEYETLRFLLEVKVVNYSGTSQIRWNSWNNSDIDLSEYVKVTPLADSNGLKACAEFYKPFPGKVIFINANLEDNGKTRTASWFFYSENPEE